MFNRYPKRARQLRTVRLARTTLVLPGAAAATPSSAQAAPDDRAGLRAVGGNFAELCLTQQQLTVMDDAGVGLGVDEIASSPNMRQVVNVPKRAPFNTESSLGTDIAFQGDYAFVGNYNGFVIYDIKNPRKPSIVSQAPCPGSQNDVSFHGNLLSVATDSPRGNDSCSSVGVLCQNTV